MKRILLVALAVSLAAIPLFADSVRKIRRDLNRISDGRTELMNPRVDEAIETPVIRPREGEKIIQFVGDVVITNGLFAPSYTTYDFKHTGAVVVSNSTIWFQSIEGEHATNTIQGPDGTPDGRNSWCVLINRATNCIWLTEGNTLDSGGIRELCQGDVMMLIGGSNKWYAIYQNN